MVPAAFEYRAPTSLPEALELLKQHGDEAKLLAGGMSLIPLLKLRFAMPGVVIDMGRVPGLSSVAADNGTLRIGAGTRHVDLERGDGAAAAVSLLRETARQIADPLVRNRGTVGGSLCHADPAGDWGSVMLALDAQIVARSAAGERTLPAANFFTGPFTTMLNPDEALVEVRVATASRSGGAYLKLERKVGDFATVGVAVYVRLGSDGKLARTGIGMTAVGPTNLRARAAEFALEGKEPSEELIAEAARLAAEASDPRSDVRGSAEYKRDVVRVFTQRGLRRAIAAAREAA